MMQKIKAWIFMFVFFNLYVSLTISDNEWLLWVFLGVYIFYLVQLRIRKNKHADTSLKKKVPREVEYKKLKLKKRYNNQGLFDKIKAANPEFDINQFYRMVKNIFIQFHDALKNDDYESINTIATNELVTECKNKISEKNFDKYDELKTINFVNLKGFEQKEGKEYIKVFIGFETQNVEYNPKTQKRIKGLSGYKFTSTCEVVFVKDTHVSATQKENIEKKTHCPNCGAPITIVTIGRCQYCNGIVKIENGDWKISSYKIF